MTYGLTDVVKDVITGTTEYVSDQIKRERLYVCDGCPEFKRLSRQCGKCGCFVDLKTKFTKSECPLKKWVE